MYICLCHALTDENLRRVAQQGARTLDQLREQTGCGDCCGCCVDEAEALLAQVALSEQAVAAFPIVAVQGSPSSLPTADPDAPACSGPTWARALCGG